MLCSMDHFYQEYNLHLEELVFFKGEKKKKPFSVRLEFLICHLQYHVDKKLGILTHFKYRLLGFFGHM